MTVYAFGWWGVLFEELCWWMRTGSFRLRLQDDGFGAGGGASWGVMLVNEDGILRATPSG